MLKYTTISMGKLNGNKNMSHFIQTTIV